MMFFSPSEGILKQYLNPEYFSALKSFRNKLFIYLFSEMYHVLVYEF